MSEDTAVMSCAAEDAAADLFKREQDLYVEWFFIAIVVYTAMIAFCASCEMIASGPLAVVLSFTKKYNLPSLATTLYPYILGAYAGAREGVRWLVYKHTDPDIVAEACKETRLRTRELLLGIFWIAFGVLGSIGQSRHIVEYVPPVLFDIIEKTLLILVSAHVSHQAHKRVMKGKLEKAGISTKPRSKAPVEEVDVDASVTLNTPAAAPADFPAKKERLCDKHFAQVQAYLNTNGFIRKQEAMQLTGLNEDQVNRLTSKLVELNKVDQIDKGKNTKYVLKKLSEEGQNDPENAA
jgi:hypothetical protein